MSEQSGRDNIEAIYKSVVACDTCFLTGAIKRSFVDIAQPRYVGKGYWTAQRRLVFLSINPGAGSGDQNDQKMRDEIYAFKAGNLDLWTLFDLQRGYFPNWGGGKFLRYFRGIGINVDNIALLNVAQCATDGNNYPDKMLETCLIRHTSGLIKALQPDCLAACGNKAQDHARKFGIKFVPVPHYAARMSIDYGKIQKSLGLAESGVIVSVPMSTSPTLAVRTNNSLSTQIIRLLMVSNPKIGKSALRYACYRDRMSPEDYSHAVSIQCGAVEAKKCNADLKWDLKHGFIRIDNFT